MKKMHFFHHLGYRTPTWFKEKARKKLLKIKSSFLKNYK